MALWEYTRITVISLWILSVPTRDFRNQEYLIVFTNHFPIYLISGNDEAVECLRKIEIIIPKDFVADGPHPAKTFDIGILNLSGQFPGESRDCIN